MEINKERANANILAGRVLSEIADTVDYRLVCLKGGNADNVICKETLLQLVTADAAGLEAAVKASQATITAEYELSDPDITLELTKADAAMFVPMDKVSTSRIISYLLNAPTGIQSMSMGIKDLVESSLNLGAMNTTETEVTTLYCLRSSVKSRLDLICRKLEDISRVLGGEIKFSLYYPGWEFKADSPLRTVCVDVFKELYGKEPSVEAVHAGLECGFFAGKMGHDFDAVSIGPDLENVHTPDERASIPSTERTWEYVTKILKALK